MFSLASDPHRGVSKLRALSIQHFIVRYLLFSFALLIGWSTPATSVEPLEIVRVTPDGLDVPTDSRQIVFEFSRPVVPIGRMERSSEEIPISTSPSVPCEWRWLNVKSLACQLSEKSPLVRSTSYQVTVRPGITTEDGVTTTEAHSYSFVTERPHTTWYRFSTWLSPTTPEIRVHFDQKVDAKSLSDHLQFIPKDGAKIAAIVAEDKEFADDSIASNKGWLVKPATELPINAPVVLRIFPGIISLEGPEKSIRDEVVVEFDTFPDFSFLGVSCLDNNGNEQMFLPGENSDAEFRCNPLREQALLFSSPVMKEWIAPFIQSDPDFAGGRKDYNPWDEVYTYSSLSFPHERNRKYQVRLPYPLKAFTRYSLNSPSPTQILDEFQRPLTTPLDIRFLTDHRRPNFVSDFYFSTLEKDVNTHLPIAITNLQSLDLTFQSLTINGISPSKTQSIAVDPAEDISYYFPLKIRTLLPTPSGAIKGYLQSTPSAPAPNNRPPFFFSQVTPFHVHAKIGHQNSLVWVTDFISGLPIQGARVFAYIESLEQFESTPKVLTEATTNQDGIAYLAGTDQIDPELQVPDWWWFPWDSGDEKKERIFFRVEKGEDIALLPLVDTIAVSAMGPGQTWISSWTKPIYDHIETWGTTPQGVYKLGEPIQYKIYVRNQDTKRFVPAPSKSYTLDVEDPTGKVIHQVKDITLSAFGAFDGEFSVPPTGVVGWYRFYLSPDYQPKRKWSPLQVLVTDFTPAAFRVTSEINSKLVRQGDTVRVATTAKLHSGGPFGKAPLRVTGRVTEMPFPALPTAYQGFFVNTVSDIGTESVFQGEQILDDQGTHQADFLVKDAKAVYGNLIVESAVRDDRGKYIATELAAPYAGRNRYVGLRKTKWYEEKGKLVVVEALVSNEEAALVTGTSIKLTFIHLLTKLARVKGPGNAYVTHYVTENKEVKTCELQSQSTPVTCSFTPTVPGSYLAKAETLDTQNRPHSTELHIWVSGKGDIVWGGDQGMANHLDIIPEKSEYKVGDTAKFLIKNPLPGAQALISIERFGIQKSWTETFPESSHVLKIPIEADHLPGFYLSVLVMSPRLDKPVSEDQVDLGKPTFRLGYVAVPVLDKTKELTVAVVPREKVYRPGDTAEVTLEVKTKQGDNPPIEFAVAVLDEAVFDLISQGARYFDPYLGFYHLEALDLRNFNNLLQLVGRRKFEKKGANSGGDGGAASNIKDRSNFKFVSYWNPSLLPGPSGKVSFSFPIPDNLTSWRVFAMAVTPEDRFGLGQETFTVNRPTEIRPALPNQVLEGDTFQARFTVMNRTPHPRTLQVKIVAEGQVETDPAKRSGPSTIEKQVVAKPYERVIVEAPITTTTAGFVEFRAVAEDAQDKDALRVKVPVRKLVAMETGATYGSTTEGTTSVSLAFPKEMKPGVGELRLHLAPTVLGSLEGAFEYMRDYPYSCWEQILTKGVTAAHFLNLKKYLNQELRWDDAHETTIDALKQAVSFQAPNGGMCYFIPTDEHSDPYLSAFTAMAFVWLKSLGYEIPGQVENKLHEYLLSFLRKDEFPSFYTTGMSSTVRAVALAALGHHKKITDEDIKRYLPHLKSMSLFGKAHFLEAITTVSGNTADEQMVLNLIRSFANETGGKLVFSETIDGTYQRILASPMRDNCAVLSSYLLYQQRHGQQRHGKEEDTPTKLVRAITQTRSGRTYWENTQENVFCMNALIAYSKIYEREKPDMNVQAAVKQELSPTQPFGTASFRDFRDQAINLIRQNTPEDAGKKASLQITRDGQGRLYYGALLSYSLAELKKSPVNSGIEVQREYSLEKNGKWELLKNPLQIQQGDIVRVDLFLSLPAPRNFVVVSDPVPGGLEPINRDLKTSSSVDSDKAKVEFAGGSFWYRLGDWQEYGLSRWSFYHQETKHDAVRYYSDYLPAGHYHLSYTAQAIAQGNFSVMPTKAEEMYDSDVYGLYVPENLEVSQSITF